ncbi:transglutaminase-like domain-containing protein [Luteibacter aegosomatissinici]|uniref:transglutaminase-like domain-containing protein n=1 Tax=Luteibacter aegosomatissinici TaxID=2911539 RepID=UPI001FF90E48|nr:transglutaminase-like domain-containing protein [Luteibacter aegosomatissinici]UPG93073.1 transglutaminase-like domain-containing protein [Luteibacter aegosomatissinici]
MRSRRGDCTEHAVLLAALARSLGIPTRVVTGLVYNDRFGGVDHVFVPHAWVQAWLDGYWVSFDSAQGVYDTTHIALAAGDGDPWRFFASTATLGAIAIRAAESRADGQATPLPSTVRPDYVRRALTDLVHSSKAGS